MGGSDWKVDAVAVRRCLDGDRDAFAQLVERYQHEIALYCHSQVLDALLAEELAQDTFLRAFERLRQLNSPERFRAWLYRIAATVVSTHGRRQQQQGSVDTAARQDLITGHVEQTDVDRHNDMREIAEDALRQLSEPMRAAVVLRICENMPYKEIAERLHIDPATAESRTRRGLRMMRVYLRRMGREDEVLDVLRYGIAGALLGSDIVAAVMERIASMPDPRDPDSRDKDMRTSAALGLALVSAILVGIGAVSTGSGASDAADSGLRAASMEVSALSHLSFGDVMGPIGRDPLLDGPTGALYDFESGDLTGWSGRHFNRRLDRYHAIPDETLHVQKFTYDNPLLPGSRGLMFRKEDRGAYLLSTLATPSFGPLTEPFTSEWDVMLGDDNYGMYLAETPPTEADSEAQVNLAGIYFTGDTLTAVAEGYPWIGRYRPDSLFHVALHVNPALRSFDIEIRGDLETAGGVPVGEVTRVRLPFAGDYRGTGVRHVVFVMAHAGGDLNANSSMMLDNVAIRPASAPAPDTVAQGPTP